MLKFSAIYKTVLRPHSSLLTMKILRILQDNGRHVLSVLIHFVYGIMMCCDCCHTVKLALPISLFAMSGSKSDCNQGMTPCDQCCHTDRDHFVFVPSQWETTLRRLSLAGRMHKMIPALRYVDKDVTMWHRLSLAGHMHKMIPAQRYVHKEDWVVIG